ncbi:hypothetical protein LJR230_002536 [Trinickia sp. LjRoot230]|uniref:hypothetical protein n=1 Tax=Trinickia sp. LjRoot230 TaxID=3342288 RepID=UPI003ECC4BA3
MSIAAVIPALGALGSLATFASSAFSGTSGPAGGSGNFDQMQGVLKRQEATQLTTMQMQTEANIQKMLADTANSIASGHLDSGNKLQNAAHKAAQGIHF